LFFFYIIKPKLKKNKSSLNLWDFGTTRGFVLIYNLYFNFIFKL